jgi:hypothetical protein
MLRKTNIKLLILAFIVTSILAQDCNTLSQNDDCEFYVKCLEDKFQCGSDGYPVGYGYRYCNKFLQYFDEFPPAGQDWIKKTLVCLKQELVPVMDNDDTSCSTVYSIAFNSHPQCYVKSGFCDLFVDYGNIKQTLSALFKVYDIKDFASATSLKQVFQTATMCGGDFVFKIMKIIKDIFSSGFLE